MGFIGVEKMVLGKINWENYYRMTAGRRPNPLLGMALQRFGHHPEPLQAIDLGCGDGAETAVLLALGWHVLAIDGEPAAFDRLRARVPEARLACLQTLSVSFEEVMLPPADLVFASLSLPFCPPEYFDALWEKIRSSIKPGGRFAGHLFGVKDSWVVNAHMNFHTQEQVLGRLAGLEVEYFHEQNEDGSSTAGPKHWHVFSMVARRPPA